MSLACTFVGERHMSGLMASKTTVASCKGKHGKRETVPAAFTNEVHEHVCQVLEMGLGEAGIRFSLGAMAKELTGRQS